MWLKSIEVGRSSCGLDYWLVMPYVSRVVGGPFLGALYILLTMKKCPFASANPHLVYELKISRASSIWMCKHTLLGSHARHC